MKQRFPGVRPKELNRDRPDNTTSTVVVDSDGDDSQKPVSSSDRVSSDDNTAGLVVRVKSSGRPFVNVYYDVGDDAVIVLEGRSDTDSEWRFIDTIEAEGGEEATEQFPWLAFEHLRVWTEETGIDIEIELVAGR